ncbi:MAG: hypothetical protein K1X74_15395 [Pirellulales bacterium]|nr:hypothetical protein [Pirellulales bacterium]
MAPTGLQGAPIYGQPTPIDPGDPAYDINIPPAPVETYELPPPEGIAPPAAPAMQNGGQAPADAIRYRRGSPSPGSSIFIPGAAQRPRPQIVRLPAPSQRLRR